jgi:large subunit ribosomal protein L3
MKFVIGKKIGMSRVLEQDKMIPVTLVLVEKCVVTQIKSEEKEGYNAIQVGFGKKKNINKPEKGHLKKLGEENGNLRKLIEFRVDDPSNFKVGQELDISLFSEGDVIKISGVSKGKGFTGVVKRHGFKGAPTTHGHRHDSRAPGSIGAAFPEHVFKGVKMAGRSGGEKTTIKNLKILKIDSDRSIMALDGSLPGARNSLITIKAI